MSDAEADRLIGAVLRGETSLWPRQADAAFAQHVAQRAGRHGVAALLHARQPLLAGWPAQTRAALRARAAHQAFWEAGHKSVLAQAVAALRAINIEPVIFKGTALAYGYYDKPEWRARSDTDMIVAEEDAAAAGAALRALGFVRAHGVSGDVVSYQDSYAKQTGADSAHTIDLHWRVSNSEVLSRLFSYNELRVNARALPALCDGALAPAPAHALLLACLHRAAPQHNPYSEGGLMFYGRQRLLWLYDIDVLARSFAPADWRAFTGLATEKGLCAVSLEAIDRASESLGAPLPDDVRAALAAAGEPVAAYLRAGRMGQSWQDFWAIETGAKRRRFLRQTLFPNAAYMREKYAASPHAPLTWLYARRAISGLYKRLGRGA